MRSIATVTVGGTLPDKLTAIASAGFDGVELVEKDLLGFGGSPSDAGRLARQLGLSVMALQPLRDFEGSPQDVFPARLDHARKMLDTMTLLPTNTLLLCSNVTRDASRDQGLMAEHLYILAEQAAQRGCRVGYEALSWGSRIKTYRDAWHMVKKVDHPSLGVVLDTFHTFCLADDVTGLSDIPPDKIFWLS